MYPKFVPVLVALIFITCSFTASGEESFKIGALHVKPRLETAITYEDNIFLEEIDEKDDLIFEITPSVLFTLPIKENTLLLDYRVRFLQFADYSEEDTADQVLDFSGIFPITSRLTLSVNDNYLETSGGETEEVSARIEQSINIASARAAYQLNRKMSMELAYAYSTYDFEADLIERDEDEITSAIFYQIFSRLSILFEYAYGQIDIKDSNDDSKYNHYLIGVRGELTSKLTGLIKAGLEDRDYDLSSREDLELLYLSADLIHQISENAVLKIGAIRRPVESIYYRDNAYTTTGGNVSFEKVFKRRWALGLSGFYHRNDYQEAIETGTGSTEREDDLWQAKVGIKYHMNDWTALGAGYEHRENDSNLPENDYRDNLISLTLNMEF